MSEEVLSQNQVENLVRAMETQASDTSLPQKEGEKSAQHARRIRTTAYDFKRPERVGKEQMRALHSLHEGLARSFGASISSMLRTMIEVKLVSVDQLTYSEFIYSLDNPSCFNVISSADLP